MHACTTLYTHALRTFLYTPTHALAILHYNHRNYPISFTNGHVATPLAYLAVHVRHRTVNESLQGECVLLVLSSVYGSSQVLKAFVNTTTISDEIDSGLYADHRRILWPFVLRVAPRLHLPLGVPVYEGLVRRRSIPPVVWVGLFDSVFFITK